MPLSPVVRERGRLVAGGVAVGSVATPILVIGLVVVGGFAPLAAAAETAFAFGGLWFGLALPGGPAPSPPVERSRPHRSASARTPTGPSAPVAPRDGADGFGAGMMLVAPVIGTVVG